MVQFLLLLVKCIQVPVIFLLSLTYGTIPFSETDGLSTHMGGEPYIKQPNGGYPVSILPPD